MERAPTQQTWAISTVESGSNDGVALGEVRVDNVALLPTCAGVTPCWAAAVAAWALTSISGSLGCHRRWQMLCDGAQSLGRSTSPRHNGGQWPQWQWQSSCRALLKPPWHHRCRCFVDGAMAWAEAVTAAFILDAPVCRTAWRKPEAATDTAGHSEHPTRPTSGSVGCFERQWRAAAALPWRSRGGHWHSASVRLAADSRGANPGGFDRFGSLQRHRRKGGCGTPRWWWRVNGRRDGGSLSATRAWINAPLARTLE